MSSSDRWIDRVLGAMTLAEKIGQMTQASCSAIAPSEVADFAVGSVLSGGSDNPTPNTPEMWADMVGSFLEAAEGSRLRVPVLYGVDAVHGHSNVGGATVFPHNIGLGAIGDPDLVRRIGEATAVEMLATGVRWAFAPAVSVPQDIRWGRTYEGYGRDPVLVSRLAEALVDGLQHDREGSAAVLACPKHFVGDGGTSWGSVRHIDWVDWWDPWGAEWQIDQGDTVVTEEELRRVHLAPYEPIASMAHTVMASYSMWNGERMHAHHRMLTTVLKGELGFKGFVVSDWMGIDQIDPSYERSVVAAINAGVDMVMVPIEFRRFIETATKAVTDGAIPMPRIDDAVRRILRAKAALGLAGASSPSAPPLSVVGADDHRSLAAVAARRSAVLLKNTGALPLRTGSGPVVIAGRAADDIGLQCGGWTVGWQGGTGPTTSGTTLVKAFRRVLQGEVLFHPLGEFPDRPDDRVGIVCVAESPYAEGPGDRAVPTVGDEDRSVFSRMRERVETLVLVVYSGRPLVIPDLLAEADAVVAAWLPGTEATELPALLLGDHQFEAQLQQPWPGRASDLDDQNATPVYPIGHGLVHGSSFETAIADRDPLATP